MRYNCQQLLSIVIIGSFLLLGSLSSAQTLDECKLRYDEDKNIPRVTNINDNFVNTDVVKCRMAGIWIEGAKNDWPSNTMPFSITYSDRVSTEFKEQFELQLPSCFEDFRSLWPLELPDRISFVLAKDRKTLNQLTMNAIGAGFHVYDEHAIAGQSCTDGNSGMAFASNSVVSICIGHEKFWIDMMGSKEFCPIIAHELAHVAQNQLLGYGSANVDPHYTATRGPTWLIEGTAVFIEYSVKLKNNPRGLSQLKSILESSDLGNGPALKDLEGIRAAKAEFDAVYLQGLIGTLVLAEKEGRKSFTMFFECVGITHNWRNCFNSSFKITVEAFYRSLDN